MCVVLLKFFLFPKVRCSNGQLGYGRRRRDITEETKENKVYTISMSTIIKMECDDCSKAENVEKGELWSDKMCTKLNIITMFQDRWEKSSSIAARMRRLSVLCSRNSDLPSLLILKKGQTVKWKSLYQWLVCWSVWFSAWSDRIRIKRCIGE